MRFIKLADLIYKLSQISYNPSNCSQEVVLGKTDDLPLHTFNSL